MTRSPSLVVVGSLMMDLVARVPRRPGQGETVFGSGFDMFLGGKGFNQAVAARRLGASVTMVGRVGEDDFGRALRAALLREGIDDGLAADPETGTGVAMIEIEEASGENGIISVPRANMRLTAADVERWSAVIEGAAALLLQLEVPVEASLAAARLARRAGVHVLLNTAPAGEVPDGGTGGFAPVRRGLGNRSGSLSTGAPGRSPDRKGLGKGYQPPLSPETGVGWGRTGSPIPKELLAAADVLVANEAEAMALTGQRVTAVEEALQAATRLRVRPEQIAVITLGELGAVVAGADGERYGAAHQVAARDTTGAGDAFCAAFAVRLMETGDVAEALAWGNAAGGCAATVPGAEPSLPARASVEALLASARKGAPTDGPQHAPRCS